MNETFAAGRFHDVCEVFAKNPPVTGTDWMWLGRAHLGLGHAENAMECFRHGLKCEPVALELQYYLGCALARMGRWTEAEKAIAPCLGDEKWRCRALATRAQARLRAGLWADAAVDYVTLEKAGRLNPRDQLAFAACLVSLQRWEQAEHLLDGLPGQASKGELPWLLKGRCREGLRQWPEAADCYRLGLEQYPESQALATRLLLTARRPSVRRPEWVLSTVGSRQRLLDAWLERQKANPTDGRLSHRIALLTAFGAHRLQTIRPARATQLWQLSFANWASLLESDSWQRNFLAERATVYGVDLTESDRSKLSEQLAEQVDRFLEHAQGDRPKVGEPTLREEYLRERAACRILREQTPRSGLPVHGDEVLVCGPVLLVHLGLSNGLFKIARQGHPDNLPDWAWPDPEHSPSLLQLSFSSLGFALAWLESGYPRRALGALRWAICPACASIVRSSGTNPLSVCREDCKDFAKRNPGLAEVPERGRRLQASAEWLRLQAQLGLIKQLLWLAEPKATEIVEHWRTALDLAVSVPRRVGLMQDLRETLLSRAQALLTSDRAGLVVELLEAVKSCDSESSPYAAILSVALTDWGIELANKGDPEKGQDCLRRALSINPDLTRARTNFVRCLSEAARRAASRSDFAVAHKYLDEADAQGSGATVADTLTVELSELAEQTRLARMDVLAEQAAAEFTRDKLSAAADCCERILQFAHGAWNSPDEKSRADQEADNCRQYLITICLRGAKKEDEAKRFAEALAWLERAQRSVPGDEVVKDQIRIVRNRMNAI